jgi:hypothetical protein
VARIEKGRPRAEGKRLKKLLVVGFEKIADS